MVYKLALKLTILYALWFAILKGAFGHGRLVDPPARGSMWRLGFSTPPNYNDHELYCGGFARQWMQNKGRCGECGDPWDLPRPRPNESGGTFGTGIISKAYRKEEEIPITVHLTANHLGWFEFRLCHNNKPKQYVKQNCLNKNVLQLVDHPGTRYEIKHQEQGLFRVRVKLPTNLTCTNCVLQWHYTSGNNWGFCPDGVNKVGCGPQEVFRGCSDIAVFEENDDTYLKFQNLTRVIDYSQAIKVNDKTGMYETDDRVDDEEDEKNDINLDWNKDSDDRGDDWGEEEEKSRDTNYSKGKGKKGRIPNGRVYVNIRRGNKKEKDSDREGENKLLSYTEKEEIDEIREKYFRNKENQYDRNDSHTNEGKYVYSDTFRKLAKNEEDQSRIRDFLKNLPSTELKYSSLQHLINKPRPTPLNKITNPEALKEDGDYSPGGSDGSVVNKLTKVLSLLLSLTASTSATSEANLLLDSLALSLSRAVQYQGGVKDFERTTLPLSSRSSLASISPDQDSFSINDVTWPKIGASQVSSQTPRTRKLTSFLSRYTSPKPTTVGTMSQAPLVTKDKERVERPYPSRSHRGFATTPGTRDRRRRLLQRRNERVTIDSEVAGSSEEQIKMFTKSIEKVRDVVEKTTSEDSFKTIKLQVPSSSLPDVDGLLDFVRSSESSEVTPESYSEEGQGPHQRVYVVVGKNRDY